MTGDGIRRRIRAVSHDLQRALLALTALGVLFFTAIAGFALANPRRYYVTSLQIAPMTSLPPLVIALAVLTIGIIERRTGYLLFGFAWLLYGAAGLGALLHARIGTPPALLLTFAIGTALVCVASLVMQVKERRR